MAATVIQNERTAIAQKVTRQPDGPGRRVGKRGELTGIGKVTRDGARIFSGRKSRAPTPTNAPKGGRTGE